MGHSWEFQKSGTKKIPEKTLAKEKKRSVCFFSPQAAAGHNSEPPQQTYYLESIKINKFYSSDNSWTQ